MTSASKADPRGGRGRRGRGTVAAAALAAAFLFSSSAETGGAMMFKYPGVNCISESVPEDGAFLHANPLNPVVYSGVSVENAPSIDDAGTIIDSAVEVFCPIPYIQRIRAEPFGSANLQGGAASGLHYYEIHAYVKDNNPATDTGWPFFIPEKDIHCTVIATDAELAEGENVFDWEMSGLRRTNATTRQTVLRWQMLSSNVSASLFLTLHCLLPTAAGGDHSQIIGYGLKKARLSP